MNIIEKITQAIFEDDEDPNKQSEYLIETYLNSTNRNCSGKYTYHGN